MHEALNDRMNAQVTKARDAIDSLLFDRRLRNVDPALVNELRLECGAASAALDGADSPADSSPMGRMVAAHQMVIQECSRLVDVVNSAPAQALAQLHVIASSWRELAEDDRGRPRSGDVADDPLHLGKSSTPEEARIHLFEVSRLFANKSHEPALVLAARVHALLTVHTPFVTDSAVVGRAAGHLMLMARGVDPDGLIPIESGIQVLGRNSYVKSLKAFAAGEELEWITWHARAVEQATAIAKQMLL